VREIIAAMKQAGINKPWSCQGRIDRMSPELLRDLADAGCDHILYGIESGSNEVLRYLHKRFTAEQARVIVEQTANYRFRIRTTYIWGFPFETLDDFYDTIAQIAENGRYRRIEVQAYLLSPLVASPLYHEYRHLLKFSPSLQFGISVLPDGPLTEYPELIDFIQKHPQLCASFYHYDHPSLDTKVQVMKRLGAGFARRSNR